MSWFSKYTFAASHPTAGDREVSPDMPTLKTVDQPSSEGRFSLRSVGTEMVFSGDDYTYFKGIDDDPSQKCELLTFTIRSTCNGVEITHFEGRINLNDALFDPLNCRLTVTPTPYSDLNCFLDNYDTEGNILSVSNKQTVNTLIGEIAFRSAGIESQTGININLINNGAGVNNTDPLGGIFDTALGWVIYWNQIGGLVETSPGIYDGDVITYWCREEAINYGPTPPPGEGWVSIGANDWARSPQTYPAEDIANPGLIFNSAGVLTGRENVNEIVGLIIPTHITDPFDSPENLVYLSYDNGVELEDALEYLIGQIDCDVSVIKSDFYRINTATAPISDPYDQAVTDFDKIILWDKSDILNSTAVTNASEALVSLKQLLDNLKATHNVDWTLEDISGTLTLVIEHELYFEKAQGIDLLSTHPDYVTNLLQYSYASGEVPRKEEFNWQEKGSFFFDGYPIEYGAGCATGDPITYSADQFFTDLGFAQQYPDRLSNDGLFVGAVYEDGSNLYFQRGTVAFNDALAYRNLHSGYWKYGRPYIEGTMNLSPTTFTTAFRLKEQPIFSLPIALNEYGQNFDAAELQNTELGWGEVLEAEYDHKDNQLTLNLRHDS